MDIFEEVMKIGFAELAKEMEKDVEKWEKENPEEASRREQYFERHKTEFEKKLLKKIEMLEFKENLK